MKMNNTSPVDSEYLNSLQISTLIDQMIANIASHPAINNEFYHKWTSLTLPLSDVELILANYFARTVNTLERVFDTMKSLVDTNKMLHDPEYRTVVLANMQNLHEELGSGCENKLHLLLLRDWINSFLKQVGSNITLIENSYEILLTEETLFFVEQQELLYSNASSLVVMGASFAQETLADYMMKKLNIGYLNNYHSFFDSISQLYLTTEYFAVHVFGVEAEHGQLARRVILSLCKTEEDFAQVRSGFDRFLTLTALFWDGINKRLS